ncbi:MAG: hypothetical protein A3K18_29890 [Lentisphaerae bacterium RIFOXYA12_64_32]|nr:MAG: hypothetical protein A3K18_29890 [Lentisphaerae bacterium RIFOXYA12_64_32]
MWGQRPRLLLALSLAILTSIPAFAAAASAPDETSVPVRELRVPFEALRVVLGAEADRVLLPRTEYEALLQKAKKAAAHKAPIDALLVSADYTITLAPDRADIAGTLEVTGFEDGLHTVPLDVSGVTLSRAQLDGNGAAIGQADDGRLLLFVDGKGRHALTLAAFAPVQTTAARQVLQFQLPTPAATRLHLTAPGDVEIKSGAAVISRVLDEKTAQTRFELLPQSGPVSLVMTLNSHLKRKERVVVARTVLIDEVTQACERLHATVSLDILHGAIADQRFAVPAGFEVTSVESPALATWAVQREADRSVLVVKLRDDTTGNIVLSMCAQRLRTAQLAAVPGAPAATPDWHLPRFEPLDVAGHVAVLGLLVEERLRVDAITATGLIPIDNAVILKALPRTVLLAEPGAPRIRPVAAYYAPQSVFDLTARFSVPPAKIAVTTTLWLTLGDSGADVQGTFRIEPDEEKCFGLSFAVPAGWEVLQVIDVKSNPLEFERYVQPDGSARIDVRLPEGVLPGHEGRVLFSARHVPKEWFDAWQAQALAFPVFAVQGAARDTGVLAVTARDDIRVRPDEIAGLTPLDENEKAANGLGDTPTNLAFRYESQPWKAQLALERVAPRVTAETYSFFRIETATIDTHCELIYTIDQARARRLALVLPATTPAALTIQGQDGVTVKEYTAEETPTGRRWTALLDEPRTGQVRLSVDFQESVEGKDEKMAVGGETNAARAQSGVSPKSGGTGSVPQTPERDAPATLREDRSSTAVEVALPVVKADGVAYQSGLVSIEGSAELDVRIANPPRRVDIGELVDAHYQPGKRLLGVYGFVGDPPAVRVSIERHPVSGLPPAIIQNAQLTSVFSLNGVCESAARFLIRTKSLFVRIQLPSDATLWSVTLDGAPVRPQQDAAGILLDLPAGPDGAVRDLRLTYETPEHWFGFWRRHLAVPAPRLFLHAGAEDRVEMEASEARSSAFRRSGSGERAATGDRVNAELQANSVAQFIEVPVTDLKWDVRLPTGYRVIRAEGSVTPVALHTAKPAVQELMSWAGGVGWERGIFHIMGSSRLDQLVNAIAIVIALVGALALVVLVVWGVMAGKIRLVTVLAGAAAIAAILALSFVIASFTERKAACIAMPQAPTDVECSIQEMEVKELDPKVIQELQRLENEGKAKEMAKSDEKPEPPELLASNTSPVPLRIPAERGIDASAWAGLKTPEACDRIIGDCLKIAERKPSQREEMDKIVKMLMEHKRQLEARIQTAPDRVEMEKVQLAGKAKRRGAVEGLRSLKIELDSTGEPVAFRGLGTVPWLRVTVLNQRRFGALAWALGLAVLVCGMAMTGRNTKDKSAWVGTVLAVSALVPAIPGLANLALVLNGAFYAGCVLIVYYLLAALVLRAVREGRAKRGAPAGLKPATIVVLVLLGIGIAQPAEGTGPTARAGSCATDGVLVRRPGRTCDPTTNAVLPIQRYGTTQPASAVCSGVAAGTQSGPARRHPSHAAAPASTPQRLVAQAFLPQAKASGRLPAKAATQAPIPAPSNVEDLLRQVLDEVNDPPVAVPDDVLVVPYDPDAPDAGDRATDGLLIPHRRYLELWKLANPDLTREQTPPPAPYALAGASYTGTLEGDAFLLVQGALDLDVYAADTVTIPLPLDGGVLARADLDGQPARIGSAQPGDRVNAELQTGAPQARSPAFRRSGERVATQTTSDLQTNIAAQQAVEQAAPRPAGPAPIVLYVTGKGRHRLDLALRLKLDRRGGWRVAEGRLPAAAGTAVDWRVPAAGMEVRIGTRYAVRAIENTQAGEVLHTAIPGDGQFSVQWRPKISEGRVDRSLTVESNATFDVQEDRLQLNWTLNLTFRHVERDSFTVELPAQYLVEKVEGTNVRGWEVREPQGAAGAARTLEVVLLKRAKDSEQFTVQLWRRRADSAGASEEFAVPAVGVPEAVRHVGRIAIRRSPVLDLRVTEATGVNRTELAGGENAAPSVAECASPLGIRPFQAYEFAAMPFSVRLAVSEIAAKATARVQTILRLAERENGLESRVLYSVRDRALYRTRVALPAGIEVTAVSAPGEFEWGAVPDTDATRQVVTLRFAAGVQGELAVLIQGRFRSLGEVAIPRLEVLEVERQEGEIAVQADPAFEVQTQDLKGLETLLLGQVQGWLQKSQRALTCLAFRTRDANYGGRLTLVPRKPDVVCTTVSNVRVTDRAIEETILLEFGIRTAGIREIRFQLPAWLEAARISVPLLRQKRVERIQGTDQVRVTLELQDDLTEQVRVLVENDRLLTADEQAVPIPVVETGRTERRCVAIESAGRDEVVLGTPEGLEPLSRQQKDWAAVAELLRGGSTQAFVANPDAEKLRLTYRTKQRTAVETAGARIGLAQTVLVMDRNGSYRAEQTYHVDNRTEQFLLVDLPPSAELWTARVAGEPVKPITPDAANPRRLGVPLVKTAAGDLDYTVVLKYGGQLGDLGRVTRSRLPLLRTVNLNVEQSQVELRLPRSYQWLRFDGNMQEAETAGEFEAGMLSYQSSLAKRLMQTLESGNVFAKARASANLSQVQAELQMSQSTLSNYQVNDQYAESQKVLVDVQRQLDKNAAQAEATVTEDNRSRFNEVFAEQKVVLGRNRALQGGANWADAPATAADESKAQPQGQVFNNEWLAQNKLEVAPDPAAPQERGKSKEAAFKGDALYGSRVSSGKKAKLAKARDADTLRDDKSGNLKKVAEENRRKEEAQAEGAEQVDRVAKNEPIARSRSAGEKDLAARYQAKLAQQQAPQQQAVFAVPQDAEAARKAPVGQVAEFGAGMLFPGAAAGADKSRLPASHAAAAPQAPPPATTAPLNGPAGAGGAVAGLPIVTATTVVQPATGLVSLDVELPPMDEQRWRSFRFTTPRGEVNLRGWAVSAAFLDRIGHLVLVLALIVLAFALPAAIRRRRDLAGADAFDRRARWLLALLGAVAMLIGFLPGLGLLALLAAPAWAVLAAAARRQAE